MAKAQAQAQALNVHVLSEGWSFRQADDTADDAWMSVKKVPTNVHLDLMDHDKYVSAFQGLQTFDRN
jgi:beta-mannosidase